MPQQKKYELLASNVDSFRMILNEEVELPGMQPQKPFLEKMDQDMVQSQQLLTEEIEAPLFVRRRSSDRISSRQSKDLLKKTDVQFGPVLNAEIPSDNMSSDLEQRLQQRKKNLWAIFLVVLSSLGFSGMNIFVKLASSEDFPSFEIALCRSIMQLLLGVIYVLLIYKTNPLGSLSVLKPLILRGSLSFVSMSLYFYGVTQLSLGVAVVLGFTGPVFTALLALIILHEKWEKLDAFGAVLSLTGVILIAQPPLLFDGISPSLTSSSSSNSSTHSLIAAGCIISGSICGAFANVLTRKMGEQVPALVMVNWFSLISVFGSPFGMFFLEVPILPLDAIQYLVLCVLGVFAFIGQSLFNRALQLQSAAKTTSITYIQIVFAFVADLIFFSHQFPNPLTLIGVLFICSWAVIAIGKQWRSDPNILQETLNYHNSFSISKSENARNNDDNSNGANSD